MIKATITSKEAHVRASKARIVTRDTGQYLIKKKNTKVKEDVKASIHDITVWPNIKVSLLSSLFIVRRTTVLSVIYLYFFKLDN